MEQNPLQPSETLYSLIGMMQRLKKDQQHNKYAKKWKEPKNNTHLAKLGNERKEYLEEIAESIRRTKNREFDKRY